MPFESGYPCRVRGLSVRPYRNVDDGVAIGAIVRAVRPLLRHLVDQPVGAVYGTFLRERNRSIANA